MDVGDMGPSLKEVLITSDQLSKRTAELAARIDADYAGRDLLLVGVLKGAVMVMADLARAMHLPVQMDWMAVSSYGSGTKSSGVVRILKDLDTDISGRHVLIVEDIIDSGLTLSWLGADGRRRGLHGFRRARRVRGGVRPRLRRAVPQSPVHRHAGARGIRGREHISQGVALMYRQVNP
jgi:hypoxanthine phosphoribosyltransferase